MGKKTGSKKGRLPTKSQAKAKKKVVVKKVSVPQVNFSEFIQKAEGRKIVLHIGCGSKDGGSGLHSIFQDSSQWYEVRLDIDPLVAPDILSDMMNMKMVPNGSVNAIWSSHNIEHVFTYQVVPVLKEFRRVIKPGGAILLATPNLQEVIKTVAQGSGLETALYRSPSGPITALDIIYGHSKAIADGHHFMAHKTGFTSRTLAQKFADAGFGRMEIRQDGYQLVGLAYNEPVGPSGKPQVKFTDPDVNKMMSERDELDQEPERWTGYSPKL